MKATTHEPRAPDFPHPGDLASMAGAHGRKDCLNCGAKLLGSFCSNCGQSADDHHRSVGHLLWEAVEGMTHLDGRLARTIPALLFHPGRLASDYMEGRRARHVPPLRLFLVSLLIFMFAAEWAVSRPGHKPLLVYASSAARSYPVVASKVVVVRASDIGEIAKIDELKGAPFYDWIVSHARKAGANKELYLQFLFEWAHRLAIFMLPIVSAFLSLSYIGKKRFFVYDHLMVSMQYLSFCFLIWAIAWVMPDLNTSFWTLAAMLWTPFNLYLILRTAYGSGRVAAAGKALFIWSATIVTFCIFVTGLVLLVLSQM